MKHMDPVVTWNISRTAMVDKYNKKSSSSPTSNNDRYSPRSMGYNTPNSSK
jgi:hypothetical protein